MFRIAVVGSGAVGCYYGVRLASTGEDVNFLLRGDVEEVRELGLRIRGKNEEICLPNVQYQSSTKKIGSCDLVVIAVKATSNDDLIELIPPLLHDQTMLLTLQNGLGNEEFLAKNFGQQRVLGGLCFICLNRVSRGVIEHYGYGHVVLGEYQRSSQPRTHEITAAFKKSGVPCEVVENLALERWRKLIWNVPFNGLSVVTGGKDTASILSDPELRSECLALMQEIILAANKCGFPLPAEAADELVKRTESMGAYKTSTLIDFEAGRPLEIEAIWGEPLRRATAAGAPAPRLQILYEKLKAMNSIGRSDPRSIATGVTR